MPSRLLAPVAIDGPAGSGKTTVGRGLAERLGYAFLDTGLIYRAVTIASMRAEIDVHSELAVLAQAEAMRLQLVPSGASDGGTSAVLDGEDVTAELHSPAVDAAVSEVSRHPKVRAAVLHLQRQLAAAQPTVVVGRDVGTVVLPDAPFKVYLDAAPEERARRRFRELATAGSSVTYEEVLANVVERDHIDSTRSIAPLRRADDARYLDCTCMTAAQVVDTLVGWVGV